MNAKEKKIAKLKNKMLVTENNCKIGQILEMAGCYRQDWKEKAIKTLTKKQRKILISMGDELRNLRRRAQKYVDKQQNIIWRKS